MVDVTCKWEHQDFFCRNFSGQRTYISNSTVLTLTQLKIHVSFKNLGRMGPVALMSIQKRRRRRGRVQQHMVVVMYFTLLDRTFHCSECWLVCNWGGIWTNWVFVSALSSSIMLWLVLRNSIVNLLHCWFIEF